ncbi:hypothetical protein SAMN04488123_105212 [Natribacillus halophilus]|uniref:Uncharacterized protein n=1 Tax=Natribacillus halophilus TaxID=549003 RepID=A0A1G8N5J4_9BACI|nr:hypothetical protein SAMN04488123_105212 [Natribacillus halophilus]
MVGVPLNFDMSRANSCQKLKNVLKWARNMSYTFMRELLTVQKKTYKNKNNKNESKFIENIFLKPW